MEVMEKTLRSLPQKNEKLNSAFQVKDFCQNYVLPQEFESTPLKINCSNQIDDCERSSGSQKTTWTLTASTRINGDSQKLITWTNGDAKSYNEFEDNFSKKTIGQFDGNSVLRDKSSILVKENPQERRKKSPKIEVCQKDFKTVVKIVVKETSTPEDEEENCLNSNRSNSEKEHIYENGHLPKEGFKSANLEGLKAYSECSHDEAIYENVSFSEEGQSDCCKTSKNDCQNVSLDHGLNINLCEIESNCTQINRKPSKKKGCSKENGMQRHTAKSLESDTDNNNRDEFTFENIENSCLACNSVEKNAKYQQMHLKHENTQTSEPQAQGDMIVTNGDITIKKYLENGHTPKDPFDSGTSSDVDSLPTVFGQMQKQNVMATFKAIQNEEPKKEEAEHKRAESLTSSGVGVDSEESDDEKSNISCDSLNGTELYPHGHPKDHGYRTPVNLEIKTETACNHASENRQLLGHNGENKVVDNKNCNGKNGLKERNYFQKFETLQTFEQKPTNFCSSAKEKENELQEDYHENDANQKILPKNLLKDIESRNIALCQPQPNEDGKKNLKTSVAKVILRLDSKPQKKETETETEKPKIGNEKSYWDRLNEKKSVTSNQICGLAVDTEQFYRFHISENFPEDDGEEDETFAGVKDYLSREKSSTITSAKGTIRGVRNRVKAGIATFLQMHENKSFEEKDAGKVVVYTTTMGIVRETYQKCLKVKQILRTLMVKFEERDVFMSAEAQEEIRARTKCNVILVPQVFVEGQHIGDSETIERLNETGQLRTIMKPYKSMDACITCKVCGGYRLLPCSVCKGSKKSIHRNHFTSEFVSLKCMNCDQVGLTKCHAC